MKKAALILMTAFLLLCLCCCERKAEEPFVVKIGPEKVYTPEFRFYFLFSQLAYENEGGPDIWLTKINGVKAEDVAKERAFESIARVKISCAQAEAFNIELTEADSESAGKTIETLNETFGELLEEIGVSQQLLESIVNEGVAYLKVFNEITKDVQISEKDFAAYKEAYINDPETGLNPDEDDSQLTENLRMQYTEKIKNDVFMEQYQKWEGETEIERNQEMWDSIHILSK